MGWEGVEKIYPVDQMHGSYFFFFSFSLFVSFRFRFIFAVFLLHIPVTFFVGLCHFPARLVRFHRRTMPRYELKGKGNSFLKANSNEISGGSG